MNIGAYARGGLTRGDHQASDHDRGWKEKDVPCGIVDEDSAELTITFGSSSKTSDFIVDALTAKWEAMPAQEKADTRLMQLKMDNGPESSGRRTQFLARMVQLADAIHKPIQLLYYPPYHSKYNPIERCWAALENYWDGAILSTVDTAVQWAANMQWKGSAPVIHLVEKVYEKGISVGQEVLEELQQFWKRSETLPKWDVVIEPT